MLIYLKKKQEIKKLKYINVKKKIMRNDENLR